jgi:UDP:flavonoid glycosyltransferase YjiC (YdhE family)
MRVLFSSYALTSHYFHMVPLAWALRASGHEVRVAGPPGVADVITRSGLTVDVVGASYDLKAGLADANLEIRNRTGRPVSGDLLKELSPEELRWFRETAFAPQIRAAEATADDLIGLARRWRPDLIVTDPLVYAAPLAAHAAGVPLVRNLFGPDMPRFAGFPALSEVTGPDIRATWPEDLLKLYDRYGVEARASYTVRAVDHTPASLQVPGIPDRLAARYVPYNGTGAAPGWLTEPRERPRVCVTWGTLTTATSGTENFLVPTVLAALAGLDVEVVATVKKADRALLGDPPENVRVIEELPLHLLLPTCDAIVSQGGTGTVLTSSALGVPQVLLARVSDQTFVATLLERTGAGVFLRPGATDADTIREAVVTALRPDGPRREAAARLRAEIEALPTPVEIARELEALV